MTFLIFIALLGVLFFLYRIFDQLPDLLVRVSEMQRDLASVRDKLDADGESSKSDE